MTLNRNNNTDFTKKTQKKKLTKKKNKKTEKYQTLIQTAGSPTSNDHENTKQPYHINTKKNQA